MQKARLKPLYFDPGRDDEFDIQVRCLESLLSEVAEILPAQALGTSIDGNPDAVVFPQMLGEAYRQLPYFQQIGLPILIITSEFGTVSMWDWEIASYLRTEGIQSLAPYNLNQAVQICNTLALKREMRKSKILVFQDNPGEGFQPSIFKRFYWWEDECTQRMEDQFGIRIIKKSYRSLAQKAQTISNREVVEAWKGWSLPTPDVTPKALSSAIKLYLAVKDEVQQEGNVLAAGINCLNESHFADTTPCLAWNMLYEENGLLWGCEADTVSMLTKIIVHKSLGYPIMMSNLYPFLMGQAALKHEHIPEFPNVADPENHLLVAHCGYLGVLPISMASTWALRPKVLAIVDENATAIDARLPLGSLTLVKLGSGMDKLSVIEGSLQGYVQYPGSHCVNGAVIRVPDGRRLLRELDSHHYLFVQGAIRSELGLMAEVFNLSVHEL